MEAMLKGNCSSVLKGCGGCTGRSEDMCEQRWRAMRTPGVGEVQVAPECSRVTLTEEKQEEATPQKSYLYPVDTG